MLNLEYSQQVEERIKSIINEYGLKNQYSTNDPQNFIHLDLFFKIFIVDIKNFLIATEVSTEMGLDAQTAAIYYSYLIALPSAENQPSALMSFFRKKDTINIDYRKIVFRLHTFVVKSNDFGDFCERWTEKVNQNTHEKSASEKIKFDLLSRNMDSIISRVKNDPIEHQAECLQVAINTHLELYSQEENYECTKLFETLKLIFTKCESLSDAIFRLNALKFVEEAIDTTKTNRSQASFFTVLRLGIHRGYLTYGELYDVGILLIDNELIDSFKTIDIKCMEQPKPTDILIQPNSF